MSNKLCFKRALPWNFYKEKKEKEFGGSWDNYFEKIIDDLCH